MGQNGDFFFSESWDPDQPAVGVALCQAVALLASLTTQSHQEDARPLVFIPNSQGQAIGWTSVSASSGVKKTL